MAEAHSTVAVFIVDGVNGGSSTYIYLYISQHGVVISYGYITIDGCFNMVVVCLGGCSVDKARHVYGSAFNGYDSERNRVDEC